MATCKDCLHEKACFGMLEAMGYKVGTDYKGDADRCDTYTPKSQYAEVKRGEWEFRNDGAYCRTRCYCTVCGKHSGIGGIRENQLKPFCPNCGAKMDGGK